VLTATRYLFIVPFNFRISCLEAEKSQGILISIMAALLWSEIMVTDIGLLNATWR